MHELPVTQSLLEIALRHAATQNAKRITDLHLVIGDLSSFVDESVQFYWDIICESTIAVGATLHFQRIKAEMACQACQQHYPLKEDQFICPTCGSADVQVVAGKEFFLDSIDIETD